MDKDKKIFNVNSFSNKKKVKLKGVLKMNAVICLENFKTKKPIKPIHSLSNMILMSSEEREAIYKHYDENYVETQEELEINRMMTSKRKKRG